MSVQIKPEWTFILNRIRNFVGWPVAVFPSERLNQDDNECLHEQATAR